MAIKIREVKLTNCFQHKKLKAELGDFHVIIGQNGSGKSNLLESLLYGLGCKFGLPGTKETMITEGEEKGRVDLTLEHEGEQVSLYAKIGASNRSLKRPDLNIKTAGDVLDYTQETLLSTPFDIVTQSSIIRQGQLEAGLFDTRAKMMTTFGRLAGLRDIETKRKQLSDEKDRLVIPMVGLNIEEIEDKIKELHAEIETLEKSERAARENVDEDKYTRCHAREPSRAEDARYG